MYTISMYTSFAQLLGVLLVASISRTTMPADHANHTAVHQMPCGSDDGHYDLGSNRRDSKTCLIWDYGTCLSHSNRILSSFVGFTCLFYVRPPAQTNNDGTSIMKSEGVRFQWTQMREDNERVKTGQLRWNAQNLGANTGDLESFHHMD